MFKFMSRRAAMMVYAALAYGILFCAIPQQAKAAVPGTVAVSVMAGKPDKFKLVSLFLDEIKAAIELIRTQHHERDFEQAKMDPSQLIRVALLVALFLGSLCVIAMIVGVILLYWGVITASMMTAASAAIGAASNAITAISGLIAATAPLLHPLYQSLRRRTEGYRNQRTGLNEAKDHSRGTSAAGPRGRIRSR